MSGLLPVNGSCATAHQPISYSIRDLAPCVLYTNLPFRSRRPRGPRDIPVTINFLATPPLLVCPITFLFWEFLSFLYREKGVSTKLAREEGSKKD